MTAADRTTAPGGEPPAVSPTTGASRREDNKKGGGLWPILKIGLIVVAVALVAGLIVGLLGIGGGPAKGAQPAVTGAPSPSPSASSAPTPSPSPEATAVTVNGQPVAIPPGGLTIVNMNQAIAGSGPGGPATQTLAFPGNGPWAQNYRANLGVSPTPISSVP